MVYRRRLGNRNTDDGSRIHCHIFTGFNLKPRGRSGVPSQTEFRGRSWASPIRLDRNDELTGGLRLPRLVYRRYWDRCLWCRPHPITHTVSSCMSSRHAKKVRRMKCSLRQQSLLLRCVPVAPSHTHCIPSKSSFNRARRPHVFPRAGHRKEALAASRFQLRLQIVSQFRTTTLKLRVHSFNDHLVTEIVLYPVSTFFC